MGSGGARWRHIEQLNGSLLLFPCNCSIERRDACADARRIVVEARLGPRSNVALRRHSGRPCRKTSSGSQWQGALSLAHSTPAMSHISADELAGSLQRFLGCLQQLGSPLSPQQCNSALELARQASEGVEAAAASRLARGRLGGDLNALRR